MNKEMPHNPTLTPGRAGEFALSGNLQVKDITAEPQNHSTSFTQVDIFELQESLKEPSPSTVTPPMTQVDIYEHMQTFEPIQEAQELKIKPVQYTQLTLTFDEPANDDAKEPFNPDDYVQLTLGLDMSQTAPEPQISIEAPVSQEIELVSSERFRSRLRRKQKPRSAAENWRTLPRRFRLGVQYAVTALGLASMAIAGVQKSTASADSDIHTQQPLQTNVAVATVQPTREEFSVKKPEAKEENQKTIEAGEVDYYMDALQASLTMEDEHGDPQPLTFIIKDEQSPDIEKADSGVSVRMPIKPGIVMNAIHGYNRGVYEHGYAAVEFVRKWGIGALVGKQTEKRQDNLSEHYSTLFAAIIPARTDSGEFIRAYDVLNMPEIQSLYEAYGALEIYQVCSTFSSTDGQPTNYLIWVDVPHTVLSGSKPQSSTVRSSLSY